MRLRFWLFFFTKAPQETHYKSMSQTNHSSSTLLVSSSCQSKQQVDGLYSEANAIESTEPQKYLALLEEAQDICYSAEVAVEILHKQSALTQEDEERYALLKEAYEKSFKMPMRHNTELKKIALLEQMRPYVDDAERLSIDKKIKRVKEAMGSSQERYALLVAPTMRSKNIAQSLKNLGIKEENQIVLTKENATKEQILKSIATLEEKLKHFGAQLLMFYRGGVIYANDKRFRANQVNASFLNQTFALELYDFDVNRAQETLITLEELSKKIYVTLAPFDQGEVRGVDALNMNFTQEGSKEHLENTVIVSTLGEIEQGKFSHAIMQCMGEEDYMGCMKEEKAHDIVLKD